MPRSKRPRHGNGDDGEGESTDDDEQDDNDGSSSLTNKENTIRCLGKKSIKPRPYNLTQSGVYELAQTVGAQCDTLLGWLANEKVTDRKEKLRVAIGEINESFVTLSSALLWKLAEESAVESMKNSISAACEKIDSATRVISSCSNDAVLSSAVRDRSYAFAATRSRSAANPTDKVTLPRGKSFHINKAERIVIGPLVDDPSRFPSSKETKAALLTSINPAALNMKVNRVSYGPKNTVIVEGDSLSADTFANSSDLSKAGLGLKPEEKSKPRLIIHDIPVETTSEEIRASVLSQNVPNATQDSIKVISLYPAREKKHRSCVIETSGSIHRKLLQDGKVCIGWTRCRIADHVNILQCFKCHGFGHKSSDCQSKACCGICSGDHSMKDCTNRNSPKCSNCTAANFSNQSHAANDVAKCPILRNKIDRKISFIDYGS